jgi:hypothetical protein
MTRSLLVQRMSSEAWDLLAPTFRDVSYRQCSSYASAAARQVGAQSELAGLMDSEGLIGLADVRVKRIPMTPFGIAYASYAPITLRDERSYETLFGRCVEALRDEYVGRRRLVLRITPAISGGLLQDVQTACLRSRGFRPSASQPARETFVLDLARPLQELRGGLDPKWRSDLVRSERADIQITRSVELADLDRFEGIFLALTRQKNFMPNQDVQFFRKVQSSAPDGLKLVLHMAWHDGELVAGHLGSYLGDTAVYLLGASTAKGRDLRAAYLLQWSAIAYGKHNGNAFYDLGGIDRANNPDVYRFKRRLNGRLVSEVGPYELAPGAISRHAIGLAEKARHAVGRHLRSM